MSDWRELAECRGHDARVWTVPIRSYISRALFVCEGCSVKVECIRDAIDNGDQGIRGGLTDAERLRVHRLPVSHAPRVIA